MRRKLEGGEAAGPSDASPSWALDPSAFLPDDEHDLGGRRHDTMPIPRSLAVPMPALPRPSPVPRPIQVDPDGDLFCAEEDNAEVTEAAFFVEEEDEITSPTVALEQQSAGSQEAYQVYLAQCRAAGVDRSLRQSGVVSRTPKLGAHVVIEPAMTLDALARAMGTTFEDLVRFLGPFLARSRRTG